MSVYYIAGPISGVDDYKVRFEDVAAETRNAGHIVLSPADLPYGLEQGQYMDICFAMIRACDGLIMLPGWKDSLGAVAEHAYAMKLDKEIVYMFERTRTCVGCSKCGDTFQDGTEDAEFLSWNGVCASCAIKEADDVV